MSNLPKLKVLDDLQRRFGEIRKLKGSESLFVVRNEAARVYFRYSKVHDHGHRFGLRKVDLRQLEGHNSYICFLLDNNSPPLFVPYADFEEVFARSTCERRTIGSPASCRQRVRLSFMYPGRDVST